MKTNLGWIAHDDKDQKAKLEAQREYYGRQYKKGHLHEIEWIDGLHETMEGLEMEVKEECAIAVEFKTPCKKENVANCICVHDGTPLNKVCTVTFQSPLEGKQEEGGVIMDILNDFLEKNEAVEAERLKHTVMLSRADVITLMKRVEKYYLKQIV